MNYFPCGGSTDTPAPPPSVGPPNQGSTPSPQGGGGGGKSPPKKPFTINKGKPPGALKCLAWGKTFLAPPSFSIPAISNSGKSGGWSPFAMNNAVGHNGTYDFQRSSSGGSTTFYTQYQVAANVAVGAYLYGTGIPEILSNAIEDLYAVSKSSNFGDSDQIAGQEIGWDAAAGIEPVTCTQSP